MKDYLQGRVDERNRVWEGMKAVLDEAQKEDRGLTAEERQTYERMEADVDALDVEVRGLLEREKKDAEADELRADAAKLLGTSKRDESPAGPNIRDLFSGKASHLDFAIPGDIQRRAMERRAGEMTVGSGGAGEDTAKTQTLVERLYEELIHDSAIFGASTMLTTASGEPLDFPRVTAANSTHAQVAGSSQPVSEVGQIPKVTPVFDKVTITPSKYAVLLQVSSELAQDTVVDLEGYIARSAAQGIRNEAGSALTAVLIAGAGDSGVTYSNFAAIADNTSGAGYDALVDLVYSVSVPNRRRASFFTSDAFVKSVRKLKDGNDAPLWQPAMVAGEPDRIMGYNVVVDPDVPVSGAGAKVVVFGDLSAHTIRQVGSLRFESSTDFAFDYDLVTYRCIWRGGSAVLDSTALKWADITA